MNSLPAAAGTITGTATVCQGQNSVTYTLPTIANSTSYVWTLLNGATGTSTTNSITVNYGSSATSGNITVKGTNSCGDGATSTFAVTVNSLPAAAGTITGTAIVCQGTSQTYSVSNVSGVNYYWSLPNGASGTSTTNSIVVDFGTSATSGYISIYAINSCGESLPDSLWIDITTPPPTPFIFQNGNILMSDALIGNQWYNQNGIIVGETNQFYIVQNSGDYYVIVSLNGCVSDTSNIINVTFTSIGSIESNEIIRIYPNPMSNELFLEIEGNTEKVNFDIFNAIGQIVFKGSLVEKTIVPTNTFAPGVYLIKLENGNTFEFKKIIKQ